MNEIKKFTLLALLLIATQFYGQKKDSHERIKSLKIAFITERLDLSNKEAQVFWPIYNEYEKNREALRQKERSQIRTKIRNSDDLTEKEANQLIEQYLSFEEEEEELDKDYIERVTKAISAKKTLLLLRAEEEFKKQLIRQYREKKGGR